MSKKRRTLTKIKNAISDRSIVKFNFRGQERIIEPYWVGVKYGSDEVVLFGWFIDGFSQSGFKNPDKRWRSYPVKEIKDFEITNKQYLEWRNTFPPPYKEFSQIIYKG